MQNYVYKRSRQKIALVRLCVLAGWYARTIVKGGWCCLFNEINPTTTTDLDKLQLLALRFIGFGKKNRIFPRLIFATDYILTKIRIWRKSLFHLFFGMYMRCDEHHLLLTRSYWIPVTKSVISLLEWNLPCYRSRFSLPALDTSLLLWLQETLQCVLKGCSSLAELVPGHRAWWAGADTSPCVAGLISLPEPPHHAETRT